MHSVYNMQVRNWGDETWKHLPQGVDASKCGMDAGGVVPNYMFCHRNFCLAKIFVRGTRKFGPPDNYFQKILVREWNNGPSPNTSM